MNINNLDIYLLNLLFKYLKNYEVGLLQLTNKFFYKCTSEYQKYEIKEMLKNNYYSKNIIDIISTNRINHFYISNSEILEKITIKPIIYIIGTSYLDNTLGSVYKISYNYDFKEYRSYHLISTNINYFNKFMGIQLIYLGGELLIIMHHKVKVYNLLSEIWSSYSIKSYNSDFIQFHKKCCIHDNQIYVTQSYWNGNDDNFQYRSFPLAKLIFNNNEFKLESFDIKTRLNKSRKGHSMVSFENKLWVAGGKHEMEYLDTVETFDFDIGAWKEEDNRMNVSRIDFKMEVINKTLYTIGGDANNDLNITIEKFDNLRREWNIITTKVIVSYYSIIVLENKILFFSKNLSNHINILDIYDVNKDEWSYSEIRSDMFRNSSLFSVGNGG